MKTKKITHSFRATNTMWTAIEDAANTEGMSANEWLTIAAVTQLREGVAGGQSNDLEKIGSIAHAEAADRVTHAITKLNNLLTETSQHLAVDNKTEIDNKNSEPVTRSG